MNTRFLLRRAAARAVSSQPSAFASAQRTFVTRTPFSSSRVQTQWQLSAFSRRFATEQSNESPAEAESSSETVETEPSIDEQKLEMKEESVATPEVADAAGEQSITETATSKVNDAIDTVSRAGAAAMSPFGSRLPSSNINNGEAPSPSKILYVGNLYFEVRAEQLERQFKPYGQVVNAKVVTDTNGLSKGYAQREKEIRCITRTDK